MGVGVGVGSAASLYANTCTHTYLFLGHGCVGVPTVREPWFITIM